MPTVKLSCTYKAKGKTYPPNTPVNVTQKEAARLERWIVGAVVAGKKSAPPSPPPPPTEERIGEVAAGIELLDSEKDFNTDGAPNLTALSKVMEGDVTDAERDAAWAKVQADREAAKTGE